MLGAVDFVSIGTNDLAQYTLAADRMSGPLAALNDPWQPALLRLIGMVGAAGQAVAKPVGNLRRGGCRPALAPVLVGLGATSLSMSARSLSDVGCRAQDGDAAAVPGPRPCSRSRPRTRTAGRAAVRAGLPALDELGL
jgi:phosphotransferase system enzyme I (PtsI)